MKTKPFLHNISFNEITSLHIIIRYLNLNVWEEIKKGAVVTKILIKLL
jgi:hypothetical protein